MAVAARSAWAWSTAPIAWAAAGSWALLFFGGVMNLYWISGIATYVLLEKLLPMGHGLGYVAAFGLIGAGVYLLATG